MLNHFYSPVIVLATFFGGKDKCTHYSQVMSTPRQHLHFLGAITDLHPQSGYSLDTVLKHSYLFYVSDSDTDSLPQPRVGRQVSCI